MPCSQKPCASGVPGWDKQDPLHRWYCRPCSATAADEVTGHSTHGRVERASAHSTAVKMSVEDLWKGVGTAGGGAQLPVTVSSDEVLKVGPLAGHDSALVLLTVVMEPAV